MTYPLTKDPKVRWDKATLDQFGRGGINTQERAEMLTTTQVIEAMNVRLMRGAMQQDTGYVLFGGGGADSTLDDRPLVAYQFFKKNGTSELVAVTKGSVYTYNTSFLAWEYVKGTTGTTLTAGAAAAATSLQVASSAGFTLGNKIGIRLTSGKQFRTTVAGVPDGTHITIPAGGLPSAAANGNAVIRAVHLNGSDDYPVAVAPVASHDWLVISNNVDDVQRYDGTDCIKVPGLPGTNLTCAALLVYNSALFLLNTTEDGVQHPQRARRSEIGDPTTWTGGTAGYDDLFDSADYITAAESLGPYMIVYKERTILRGQFVNSGGLYYNFEPVVRGEGLAAYQGLVDMGDYHICLGNSNVFEYRGGFDITPIGDNIFYNIFSSEANVNTAKKLRNVAFYVEELDEVWLFYCSGSADFPDRMLRYKVKEKAWYNREFADAFVGYGFYQRNSSVTWAGATGTWASQTNAWNSRAISAQSPTTLLCAASGNQVWEYDYVTTTEGAGAAVPTSVIETRDFIWEGGSLRTDRLDMVISGTSITIEYSADEGLNWDLWEVITEVPKGKVRSSKQVVVERIRFRFTCADPQFRVDWISLMWRPESVQ